MTDPGWRPRLVALDIDGTLVSWLDGAHAEEITEPVVRAVQAAEAAGAHVVLSSGRSAHGMRNVAGLLGLTGQGGEASWGVASNGSVVYRYRVEGDALEVEHEETFDAAPAVNAIVEAMPDALVAVEHRGVGYRLNRHFPDGELTGEISIATVAELVAEPVNRVIIRNPEASVEEFQQMAQSLGLHGVNYVIGWTAWLDLSPDGVSKASGLDHVAKELGLTAADVLAIGDGRNDLEMLQWAGRGVAMGQAVDEVKDVADDVTQAVTDDGVAAELGRWF